MPRQPGSDPADPGRVLPPGQCLGVAGRAQRDGIRVLSPRPAETPHTWWSGCSVVFESLTQPRLVLGVPCRYGNCDHRLDARRADRVRHPVRPCGRQPLAQADTRRHPGRRHRRQNRLRLRRSGCAGQRYPSDRAAREATRRPGPQLRRRASRRRRRRPRRGSGHAHAAGGAAADGRLVQRRSAQCHRPARAGGSRRRPRAFGSCDRWPTTRGPTRSPPIGPPC